VPAGFTVELVAEGLPGPRVIRRAPNGDLFVADSKSNTIRVYRVPPGSAKPAQSSTFAKDLHQPYGIAFYPVGGDPQWVYVANSDGAVRFAYKNGDLQATGAPEKIVQRIPWTHHWTRDIVFAPDGKKMYYSVGSGSNAAQDMFPQPHMDGGLEAWAKSEPLGAAWDTEERRAGRPLVRSRRYETARSTRPACAIATASPSSRGPTSSGASCRSATSWATTSPSNTRPTSRRARSTAGRGSTSATTRIRGIRSGGPTSPAR
jgi:hypothetical protein